jgi:starch synthase
MRAAILTREYPPDVYGGAGVHVDFLVRELRRLVTVDVHCMGEPREGATAHSEHDPRLEGANAALSIMSADLSIAAATGQADLVHSHTWYANFAGHLAKLLHGVPHVVTAHSLEPQRPWKAEQLGGGYRVSSWVERTAYERADAVVAVSRGMAADVLEAYPAVDPSRVHVIHNGIDADFYRPDPGTDVLERIGVDLRRPYVTFVGRITRQKGVPHLLRAGLLLDPDIQLVLLAGAADTAELKEETDRAVAELRATRDGVFVVSEMLPREEVRQVLTHAAVFCCPSVYEPLGIVNLEAMACETAVVASRVGGIPEVVVEGETGLLVDLDPQDPADFERRLAEALDAVAGDSDRAAALGRAGRVRAVEHFEWSAVAARTVQLYTTLLTG